MNRLMNIMNNQIQHVGLKGEIEYTMGDSPNYDISIIVVYVHTNGRRIILSRESVKSEFNTADAVVSAQYNTQKNIMDDLAFGLPEDKLRHIKGNTYSTNYRTLISNPKLIL